LARLNSLPASPDLYRFTFFTRFTCRFAGATPAPDKAQRPAGNHLKVMFKNQ